MKRQISGAVLLATAAALGGLMLSAPRLPSTGVSLSEVGLAVPVLILAPELRP